MKTLNIEMTVRRMEAQNILTASVPGGDIQFVGNTSNYDITESSAAGRTATPVAPGSFRN